ncbi:probable E3 ubiquitin-protein ligase RHY1A, partial [Asparagus officinalis]
RRRDDPDPLPRSQYARGNFCRRVSQTEHESVRLTRRSSIDLEARNRDHVEDYASVASRPRRIRNNQLPDDVVQARERLLERLGSVSLTATREDEALRRSFNSDLQYLDFTPHNSKKSFSVSWEALCNLYLEVYRNSEEIGQITASQECCICLESFCEGDGLIRLQCGHRFHTVCLKPWVRTCSYCPYCRRNI